MPEGEPVRFQGTAKHAGGALVVHPNAPQQQQPLTVPSSAATKRVVRQQVPDSILNNSALAAAASVLPANYNFEIHKTVWRIHQAGAKQVALQFPEGLLMYACTIADILQEFAGVEHCYVMGDVTYGACCIDDFSAAALGADFLVHYGHSCLVPVDVTSIPCLYIFVDIQIDVDHLVETIRLNFPAQQHVQCQLRQTTAHEAVQQQLQQVQLHVSGRSLMPAEQVASAPPAAAAVPTQQGTYPTNVPAGAEASIQQQHQPPRLILAGTIQFSSAIQLAKQRLAAEYPSLAIPKCRPLSPGEVLGCTAPVIQQDADALVFVADGRFHLEAIMIANPTLSAYRYDPYSRKLTIETYDQEGMRVARRKAIQAAAAAKHWGVVLGTLGRQGNPRTMQLLQQHLQDRGAAVTTVLLSEVTPLKLAAIGHIDAWVQVACPRLSIDWGEGFNKPTLTPYEAMIALGLVPGWWEDIEGVNRVQARTDPYPMDYYAKEGGVWNSSYHKGPVSTRSKQSAGAPAGAAISTPRKAVAVQ